MNDQRMTGPSALIPGSPASSEHDQQDEGVFFVSPDCELKSACSLPHREEETEPTAYRSAVQQLQQKTRGKRLVFLAITLLLAVNVMSARHWLRHDRIASALHATGLTKSNLASVDDALVYRFY